MHPIIQAEVDEFRKEFKISDSSGEDFGPLMIEVKSVEQFLSAALHRAVESAGKEVWGTKAKKRNEGKDELYCNFIRCLECNESSNPEGGNFCLSCGKPLTDKGIALALSKLDTIINFKER